MKFWHHPTTDYPHIPADVDNHRVTIPSRLMDPQIAADSYHRWIDEWQIAEGLGFGIMINEHHQQSTCLNPALPVLAGIAARATSSAPILVLGNPVANRREPLRVAEEMAMIDLISRGRLEVGFVRGVPFEISAMNSRPVQMSERLWEAHDLIVRAWTSHDGPFNWTGRFFEHRQVNVWPRPYRQPHPPVWISTLNPASVGPIADHDYTVATFLIGKNGARDVFAAYRERRAERAATTDPLRLAYCAVVAVGDTDEEGRMFAEKIIPFRRSKHSEQFILPAGYAPPRARVAAMRGVDKGHSSTTPLDELIEDAQVFCGNPETVRRQIERFNDYVGGFGQLLLMSQSGHLDHAETVKSLTLFANEVAPGIADLETPAPVAP